MCNNNPVLITSPMSSIVVLYLFLCRWINCKLGKQCISVYHPLFRLGLLFVKFRLFSFITTYHWFNFRFSSLALSFHCKNTRVFACTGLLLTILGRSSWGCESILLFQLQRKTGWFTSTSHYRHSQVHQFPLDAFSHARRYVSWQSNKSIPFSWFPWHDSLCVKRWVIFSWPYRLPLALGITLNGKGGTNKSLKYVCFCIVLHIGGQATAGHYICLIRCRKGPKTVWKVCNDEYVSPSPLWLCHILWELILINFNHYPQLWPFFLAARPHLKFWKGRRDCLWKMEVSVYEEFGEFTLISWKWK